MENFSSTTEELLTSTTSVLLDILNQTLAVKHNSDYSETDSQDNNAIHISKNIPIVERILNYNDTMCMTKNRNYTTIYRMYFGGIFHTTIFNVICTTLLVILFSIMRQKAGSYARLALFHNSWRSFFNVSNRFKPHQEEKQREDSSSIFNWILLTYRLTDADFYLKVNSDAIQYLTFQRYLMFLMVILTTLCLGVLLPVNYFGGKKWNYNTIGRTSIENLDNNSGLIWMPAIYTLFVMVFIYLQMIHFRKFMPFKSRDNYPVIMIQGIAVKREQQKLSSDNINNNNNNTQNASHETIDFGEQNFALENKSSNNSSMENNIDHESGPSLGTNLSSSKGHKRNRSWPGAMSMKFPRSETLDRYQNSTRVLRSYIQKIEEHFKEAYGISVVDVQLTFDVEYLVKLVKNREKISNCRNYCARFKARTGHAFIMHSFRCGVLCTCFGCCKKINAEEYYKILEDNLIEKIFKEERAVYDRPLNIAFVILQNSMQVAQLIEAHSWTNKLVGFTPTSKHDASLDVNNWKVTKAPLPNDIFWENLGISSQKYALRWLFVNFLFAILFLFATTPAIGLSALEYADRTIHWTDWVLKIPYISTVVTPLLFVIIAAVLPFIVLLISDIRGFRTKSQLNHSATLKIYVFLMFMVLILPSIGLTTATGFIKEIFTKKKDGLHSFWECVFFPDNGAFFINYVISASMLGLVAELLRIADLLWYLICLLKMRSKAERRNVKKTNILEFPYGFTLPFTLLVVTIVIVYSPLYPLIAPFGLFYMFMRHFIDKYNLYFSFSPSRLNPKIYRLSVNCMILASLLMVLVMLCFTWLRLKGESYITSTLTCGLITLVTLIIGKTFFNFVRNLSPATRYEMDNSINISRNRFHSNRATTTNNNNAESVDSTDHSKLLKRLRTEPKIHVYSDDLNDNKLRRKKRESTMALEYLPPILISGSGNYTRINRIISVVNNDAPQISLPRIGAIQDEDQRALSVIKEDSGVGLSRSLSDDEIQSKVRDPKKRISFIDESKKRHTIHAEFDLNMGAGSLTENDSQGDSEQINSDKSNHQANKSVLDVVDEMIEEVV